MERLLRRRGGRDIKKKHREASFDAADGVVVRSTEMFLNLDRHHPVCAANRMLRGLFFLVAQPPLLRLRRGADCCNFKRSVNLDRCKALYFCDGCSARIFPVSK